MSTMIPGLFTRYTFEQAEEIQSRVLAPLQVQMLHNIMADLAESQVQAKFNPADVNSFIQNNAYASGKIDLIKELLQANEQALADLESYRQTLNQTQPQEIRESTNLFDIFNPNKANTEL